MAFSKAFRRFAALIVPFNSAASSASTTRQAWLTGTQEAACQLLPVKSTLQPPLLPPGLRRTYSLASRNTGSGSGSVAVNDGRATGVRCPYHFAQQLRRRTDYVHFPGRGPFGTGGAGSDKARVWLVRAGVLGGGCALIYFSTRQEIPYSHRYHMVLLSPASARALGEATYKQIIADARSKNSVLHSNHPRTALVRKVGEQLAEAATKGSGGGFYEHMKDCEWEFVVIKSPQINAFVVPGGKVVVFSGLLDALAKEDELAFVLAHEIAHIVARHSDEKISTSGIASIFNSFFYMVFGFSLEGALVLALELPYSRRIESEADLIGLHIMAEACYDPRYAPGVHKKIEDASPQSLIPALLSTHPPSKQRIKSLVENVPEAMMVYQAGDCHAKRSGLFASINTEITRQAVFNDASYF